MVRSLGQRSIWVAAEAPSSAPTPPLCGGGWRGQAQARPNDRRPDPSGLPPSPHAQVGALQAPTAAAAPPLRTKALGSLRREPGRAPPHARPVPIADPAAD